jgi:hypothetical protein
MNDNMLTTNVFDETKRKNSSEKKKALITMEEKDADHDMKQRAIKPNM